MNNLSKSILELYRTVTGNKTATFQDARLKFANLKIYEPLARARGIAPQRNEHILDDGEYEETPIKKVLEEFREKYNGGDWEDDIHETSVRDNSYCGD